MRTKVPWSVAGFRATATSPGVVVEGVGKVDPLWWMRKREHISGKMDAYAGAVDPVRWTRTVMK